MRGRHRVLPAIGSLILLAAAATVASVGSAGPPVAAQKYDWLQFQFDQEHSGNDTAEYLITPSNVNQLTQLFNTSFSDAPDGGPVYLSNVQTAQGTIDMIFVSGEHGTVTAFNADTGAQVWQHAYTAATVSGVNNTAPAIDPNRQFLYIQANDGLVHKLNVGDGSEVTGGNWPVTASLEHGKPSGEMTFATARDGNTYLTVANNNFGHITTINLATGASHVFNLVCAGQADVQITGCSIQRGASPWIRAAGTYDPYLDETIVGSGTNDGPGWIPGQVWRDSFLALPPDGHTIVQNGGGYPLDSYTASDWASAVSGDRDEMVGGLEILPHGYSSKYPDMGLNCGKDGSCRLLNLANLSGQGGPGHTGGEILKLTPPGMSLMRESGAVWVNPQDHTAWVFQPGNGGLVGLHITVDAAGNPSVTPAWHNSDGRHETTVVANNVVFTAAGGGEGTGGQPVHAVQAIDPTTGHILWSGSIGQFHWSHPIVDNGVVYMVYGNSGGFGSGATANIVAWHLPSGIPTPTAPAGSPSPSPTLPPPCSSTPIPPTGVMVTPGGGGQATVSWTEPVTCTRTVEYALYIYCADGSTQFTTTTATSDPVTGLPPNVYCTATVTGYSTAWSAWSGWASYALIT